MNPIIKIENIGKKYALGVREPYYSLRDTIADFFKGKNKPKDEFWALKNVSFEVQKGEVIGIIGRNGAGKSTLLKILSRITPPTEGKIEMRGRVASLLEVGTGFNPELTGRENIYLNGAILGMSKKEINEKFDQIVEFSEIGKFLDTPVKRYSSGMYVRLAFSVAAHLEPEILIIDEVLAVGDAAFQEKCLGKINEVSKGGRTVLFVSHNMVAVEKLCKKSIFLENGKIIARGDTGDIINQYLNNAINSLNWELVEDSTSDIYFTRISMQDENGSELHKVTTASKIRVAIEFEIKRVRKDIILAMALMDDLGNEIFVSVINDCGIKFPEAPGKYLATVELPGNLYFSRPYTIRTVLWSSIDGGVDYKDILKFIPEEAASLCNSIPGGRRGKITLQFEWKLIKK